MTWQQDAACRDSDLDWFPTGDPRSPGYRSHVIALKAVCAVSPSLTQCRAAGANEWGVWGGLDDRERGVKLSHHPVAEHGTPGAYRQHYKRGEKPCDECRVRHNERQDRFRDRRRNGDGTPSEQGEQTFRSAPGRDGKTDGEVAA